MHTHLLLFARDPGATNQALALLRVLDGNAPGGLDATVAKLSDFLPVSPEAPAVTTVARDYACGRLSAEGIPHLAWAEYSGATDTAAAAVGALRGRMTADGITHVVTGVSDNDDKTHQWIWQAAREAGIPSATLLDDDLKLAAQFSDEAGGIVWPNRIYAVSERTRAVLLDLGIPDTALEVIANLHLARLLDETSDDDLAAAKSLRKSWGASADDHVVLFASQPIREMCAFGKPANFDEFDCLEQLSRRLSADGAASLIVVRPHPRDLPGKYDQFAGDGPPRTVVSGEGTGVDAIRAADAVAGMTSMMLTEAEVLSRPVIYLIGDGSEQ